MDSKHPGAGGELLRLADDLERAANNTLKSAEWFWGWRKRDRKVSIAFGQISRDLRAISERVGTIARASMEQSNG